MGSYYIYYKVSAERVTRVRQAVEALQRVLAAATGVQGRLLCRRDQPDTWMEIYEEVRDDAAFEQVLHDELARVGFEDLLGPRERRFTEVFVPLPGAPA
jgi:hypothetical protein